MEHNEQLLAYVRESLAQGRSQASLANDLTAAGWPAEDVSAVFEKLAPPKPVMPLPPMPRPAVPEPAELMPEAPHIVSELASDNISMATEVPAVRSPKPAPTAAPHAGEYVDEGDQHKKVVRVIVTTGAILLGIGIYYYLAIHWQDLAEGLRIAIILFSMLAAYGSGWYLREKANLPKIGTALILLGTVMYGAGIFLVGRMYHITGHVADGWALWSFGSLLMGSATRLYQLKYFGILLSIVAGSLYLEALSNQAAKDGARVLAAILALALTALMGILAARLRRALPDESNRTF